MNLMEICITLFQLPLAAWDYLISLGRFLSADLLCSMSVNSAILAVVLMGAIWLVVPFDLKSGITGHRSGGAARDL